MNQTQSSTVSRSKTYEITITALMTAVTCILAPMSIPIGPVPISFTNLAIYLSLYLLGWKKGTISYLIYQLIGMIVGTIVCYLFGTVWFCVVAGYTFQAALAVCVIPFIPADLVKMIIAMLIGPMIKKRIR